jgi:hypothetical protein
MYALKLIPFNISSSLKAEIENPHIYSTLCLRF